MALRSTFFDQLLLTASRDPDRLAVVEGERRRTWTELVADVNEVAARLVTLGVGRGDKVAIWLPNLLEWPTFWLAAASLGAAAVPLNTRYKADEVAYVLKQSESTVLLVSSGFLGIDFRSMLAEVLGQDVWETGAVTSARCPALRHVVRVAETPAQRGSAAAVCGMLGLPGPAPAPQLEERRRQVQPDDDVILVYTSGTTGFPKGARHTHETLSDLAAMAELMSVTRDDRILAHMPFFHVGGAFLSIVTALLTGCSMVCLESFGAAGALALIEEHGCTVINGVPSHFIMMLTELEKRQTTLSSPRIGWIAGAMIPPEVVTAIRRYFGMNLVTMYGMTESTGVITSTRPDDPIDVLLQTVGTAIASDYEVRITNPATLAESPRGEQGEIWMRGHRVTRGYYKMPEETAASLLPDGWFRTGDLGVMRADGRLRITGRLKDMFIVGGTNAYPAEIEHVLGQLPAVNQVHVIGIPDERLGEVPMAFIERRQGHALDAEEVIAFSRAKLANYKCPRFVEFVDAFPMTASGKIQKYKLREQAIAKLGLEELARRRLLEYQRD